MGISTGRVYLIKPFYGKWQPAKVVEIDSQRYFNFGGSYININQVEEVMLG